MTTKTYENMTVTVTCNESEDTEMMELIKKMNDTKATRERTEEFYLPRIKAIGVAKWAEICNQLLGLCETATSFNMKGTIDTFLKISFCRDDTGERCRMWLSYSSAGKNKGYFLNCSVEGGIADTCYLNPGEEYYSPRWGEDKDSWLVKWDDYNIYNLFRSALMREIERRIIMDESRIRSVRENYDEIAGK
mgnify:CR=1 FL=1